MNISKLLKEVQSMYESDYLFSDYDCAVYAKPPTKFSDLPELEEIKGLTRLEHKEIYQHFEEISDLRIHYINGFSTSGIGSYSCDYCYHECKDTFKRCMDCNKDMCNLCHSETSEEIAIENGAQNWEKRKDALLTCHKHNLKEIDMKKYKTSVVYCDWDDCENYIVTPRYSNREKELDYCLSCFENKDIENKDSFELVEKVRILTEDSGFGSILDWIPLYKDEDYNNIIYCANPDSDNYGKWGAISPDDHGRTGWVMFDINFDELKDELEKYYDQWIKDFTNGGCSWEKSYNIPIKQMLIKRNFQYHYG